MEAQDGKGTDLGHVDCVVVGAGVVGLAIARSLALAGREVVILECNPRIGEETSSRNNGVIHAGFLYAEGSLKERLCAPGGAALYRYCEERGIGHARVGKLMPALTEGDLSEIARLKRQADRLGIPVARLDAQEVRSIEPQIDCLAALHCPGTGMIDAPALMVSLLGDAENCGATLSVMTRVCGLGVQPNGHYEVTVQDKSGGTQTLSCTELVNAAGLDAARLAASMAPTMAMELPPIHLAKGAFFSYAGRAPFKHVVAMVSASSCPGGSFTFDLGGAGRFGPDLEWVEARDYSIDPARAAGFVKSIRAYWPAVDPERLAPGFAGIRPQLSRQGGLQGDWFIAGSAKHELKGLVHLLGIDTPGLTACLAIAEYVQRELDLDRLTDRGDR